MRSGWGGVGQGGCGAGAGGAEHGVGNRSGLECLALRARPTLVPGFTHRLQARTSCGTRYLGASAANCTNQLVALYNKADTAALTLWQLIPVA